MRFISMIMCCAMAVLPLCTKAENNENPKGAHIKFESTTCDFGTISRNEDGDTKTLTLRFVNDGTEPLVLFAATTSCTCLKPEISRKPVAVGQEGEVKIILDLKKMEKGVFHRVVRIRSNTPGEPVVLTIQGFAKD